MQYCYGVALIYIIYRVLYYDYIWKMLKELE